MCKLALPLETRTINRRLKFCIRAFHIGKTAHESERSWGCGDRKTERQTTPHPANQICRICVSSPPLTFLECVLSCFISCLYLLYLLYLSISTWTGGSSSPDRTLCGSLTHPRRLRCLLCGSTLPSTETETWECLFSLRKCNETERRSTCSDLMWEERTCGMSV